MNQYQTRRQFLKTSGGVLALAAAGNLSAIMNANMRLSFSTLGCPDWNFEKIIGFASENGYTGIEVRGILRQMDLPQCPEFNSAAAISETMKKMKDHGLRFVNLGSSAEMHRTVAEERQKHLDDAKRFIDLAQKLECPYVRVFPNKLPKENMQPTIELIIAGLKEVGDYAKESGVKVLLETHGDLVESDLIKRLMKWVDNPQVGLIWDVSNMWTMTKESPKQVYGLLKEYIHHTHIKDATLVDGKPQYKLLGKGEVPIFEAIQLLKDKGYPGYYSFEWEKLWHPEIDEPEIALADYPKVMKRFD